MPPRKRKAASLAEADEEPKPKMSKKEARELAKRRARLSMQKDKEKVEALKAKKEASKAEPEFTSPKKRRKISDGKKAPSTKKVSPKKTQTTTPKATSSAKPASTKETAVASNPPPATAPTASTVPSGQQSLSPMNYQTQNAGISAPAMSQYMMQQRQNIQQEGQPQQWNPYTYPYLMAQHHAYNAPLAYGYNNYCTHMQQVQFPGMTSPTNYYPYQQPPVQASNLTPPKVQATTATIPKSSPSKAKPKKKSPKASKATKRSPKAKDTISVPPPSLEMQISQQVMENVEAAVRNKPTPHTMPPSAAFQNGVAEEVTTIDKDIDLIDEEEPKKKSSFSRRVPFAIIVGILSYFLMPGNDGVVSSTPPCFMDNVATNESGEVLSSCIEGDGVPCPEGGVCKDGKLVDCSSKYFEVSENEADCVLTESSMASVNSLQEKLEELSVKDGCTTEMPLFDYSEIQLSDPSVLATNSLEWSILESKFKTELRDGIIYIGLPDDYDLNLSAKCKTILMVKALLGAIGGFLVFAGQILIMASIETITTHPVASIIGLLVAFLIKRIMKYRSYRSQLVKDVDNVRKAAYDYLEEHPNNVHVVLHVRDHIVMKQPKSQRLYFTKEVWPCVIPDFKYDNRIRKSTRVIDGAPRDHWQWVAASSTKKKDAIQ